MTAKMGKQNPIRPNVGDIVRNFQHPLYEKDFEPTEVKSLAEILPKPRNIYDMANAEILGDSSRSTDLDQKPTMYSTVVSSHATSVIHPAKPIGKLSIVATGEAANLFADTNGELAQGRFSTHVQISDLDTEVEKNSEKWKNQFLFTRERKAEIILEVMRPLNHNLFLM